MERKEYLEWCRDCAVLPQGMYHIRRNVPDGRKVVFNGIPYYPQGYLLEFDERGATVHTAILHDLVANSVVRCPLQKVEKFHQEVVSSEC